MKIERLTQVSDDVIESFKAINVSPASMRKKADVYIIHGYTASSRSNWFPWLKDQFDSADVKVHLLDMPDSMNPKLDKWMDHLMDHVREVNENTIFIGHSLGCITSLKFIIEKKQRIKGIILVSGFIDSTPLPKLQEFVEEKLDCDAVKKLVGKRVTITAKDDDIVPYEYSKEMASALDTDFYLLKEGKHFIDRDGYIDLPVVKAELNKMLELPV